MKPLAASAKNFQLAYRKSYRSHSNVCTLETPEIQNSAGDPSWCDTAAPCCLTSGVRDVHEAEGRKFEYRQIRFSFA